MIAVAPSRETFVVNVHDLCGKIAIRRGVPPEGVDIQHLNVDAALVQCPNAIWPQCTSALSIARQRSSLHHICYLGDAGMSMHVDYLDLFSAHAHIAMRNGSARVFSRRRSAG